MNNFKKIQEAIINAVNTIVEKKLKNIKRNYYADGVIKNKNSDYTYDVLIANEIYKNIPSQHRYIYKVGDTVQILVKNGDWSKKIITGYSYNNKFSTPIANQYNSIDGTGEEFPLICHNGDNIWVGAFKRATRHHAGKGTYGKLFLSAGYNADLKKGNDTVYVSVPNSENTEATNYRVVHAGNLDEINTHLNTYLLDSIYPVGSIYMSVNNVSPATFLGGTWERWGNGRVPVGVDTGDTNFKTVEKTGGASTVTLTTKEMPKHRHTFTPSGEIDTVTLTGSIDNMVAQSSSTGITGSGIIAKTQDVTGEKVYYGTSSQTGSDTYSDSIDLDASHNHTFTGTSGNTGYVGEGASHNNLQPYITCYMWKRVS